ncbi:MULTISPECIES: LysR family transcriptional regulator [unclassified Roseibium]|uniref:LysR family transcriptional regulator n=1 Tax=unclassified Roseibium TaxID=2629323 RepID=UPI000928444A|nr:MULTISPECIES: LysR family transcriptional regulator [unclassified Roseibium]OJJ12022.1 transcriptional regulator [Alphaproteobacteria bacterium AO1-B]
MKRSEIPSLDDLRAFEAVARLGSVRAAADDLALTHGAVSRRITKLSRDLQIPLVTPEGRGIAMTPEGKVLSEAVGQALALISKTLTSIRVKETHAPIVLSCERSVAMRWLIPRLSQFQEAHPDIPVHLSVGGGTLNFARDGVTLAVRRLDFPVDPDWRIIPLFGERVGVVMVPEMLGAFQAGGFIGLGSKTRPDAWSAWLDQNPEAPKPAEIRLFDHHFLLAEAAASGLGVAVCPHIVACDDIERRRLIAPLGFVKDGSNYGLIDPGRSELSEAARRLAHWIGDAFAPLRS